MSKRFLRIAALVGVVSVFAALPASASATSPWWQVLTGSHPTNMWVPQSEVQELNVSDSAITLVQYEGQVVACMGEGPAFFGFPFQCSNFGLPRRETAGELQEALEVPYGAGNVEVSEDPTSPGRFVIKSVGASAGRYVKPLTAFWLTSPGDAHRANVVTEGGSGRLVVTLTNLGDASVDGASSPVTIDDQLPEGVVASGIDAQASDPSLPQPVDCTILSESHVSCSFEHTLTAYEAIEIEIFASLTGDPPAAGQPGKVTVTGGNAPPASASQPVQVSPTEAPLGIERFSSVSEEEGGGPTFQAGAHPFQLSTTLQFTSGPASGLRRSGGVEVVQHGQPRNLRFPLPAGFVGNPSSLPTCSLPDFFKEGISGQDGVCPKSSVIGVASVTFVEDNFFHLFRQPVPAYNLVAGDGEPARLGFMVAGSPVVIDTAVDPNDRYRLVASIHNASQTVKVLSTTLTLWGTPGDPRHDPSRGRDCLLSFIPGFACEPAPGLSEDAFLRQPVACDGPLDFGASLELWNRPSGEVVDSASFAGEAMHGCERVPFDPSVSASPTSKLAANPSGFDFQLTLPNSGLLNPEAIAEAQPKRVEVTLPEGVTVNPSEGEGLVGCSPAEYARETASSEPGAGCPNAAKIGEVQVSTPLLKEEARGALYIAAPRDNPFGSLLALYMVARIPERGIIIKLAGRVEPDPRTGRLTTVFDDLPQLPFSSFKLHFREGGRAPLVTPPACGNYQTEARFVPWSASSPPLPNEIVTRTASFSVEHGVDGGACPPGGMPPFHPGLDAGTLNNAAGSFSPFNLRLTRNDSEQEFTNFSIKLPPGVIGKLAGIPFCPDGGIAQAKGRTGPNGGAEELASPSCPAASEVGHTLVGAGVGPLLTYVPGKLYLAGSYHGSALSIVAITAAKVGPFDLGTVVVREALKINPETAEVFVDATGSDPIPHIIQGIPVHARDIRVYVDRAQFVLNPTDCTKTSTASTVLGSGLDFGSEADDVPVTVTSPFQAADCASLGFKPKLSLKLFGGTTRGATPGFRAVLRARKGDANIGAAQVTLPHSEFLEQAHIRTICTRTQFAAGDHPGERCPAASVYGHAKAITPLLDEPIQGPVFLRSSSHKLPDLVAALHSGKIDVNLIGRIDSVKGGRIRNTFESVPDAPVTKFTLTMQGGKKGLLVNSTDICRGKNRAFAAFTGQNGKQHNFSPPLKGAACGKKARHKGGKGGHR
jgi:hypothetical protein